MEKFNKIFSIVIVLVVLIVLAPACKTEDPVQVDEFDRASVIFTVTTQYDNGVADISPTMTFHVKTFAPTRIEGTTYIECTTRIYSDTRIFGMDVPNTNGKWQDVVKVDTDRLLLTGTYNVWGEYTMLSIGKMIVAPTTQVTVK